MRRFSIFLLRMLDCFILFLSAILAIKLKFGVYLLPSGNYEVIILVAVLLLLLSFSIIPIYTPLRSTSIRRVVLNLLFGIGIVSFSLALFFFFTKTSIKFSREWVGDWMVLSFMLMIALRLFFIFISRYLRSKGLNVKNLVIIGAGSLGRNVASEILKSGYLGYNIISIIDDKPEYREKCSFHFPCQSFPADFEGYLRDNKVDDVWITLPLRRESKIKEIMHMLRYSTFNVSMVPDIFGLDLLNHSIGEIAGIPILNLRSSPITGFNYLIKRAFDIVFSLSVLTVLSPLYLFIMLMVKLSSPGPIFYRQKRVTWNGTEFDMLKFRSMPVNSETQSGAVWAKPGENRATKVGAFLRKVSLDELPQFINVLKGDMSVVGPRPERPVFVEKFKHEISGYMQKHMVQSGITGWAQVNGWRGNTDLKRRIEFDLYYIENWSIWLDIKIIFLTFFKGFIHENAY